MNNSPAPNGRVHLAERPVTTLYRAKTGCSAPDLYAPAALRSDNRGSFAVIMSADLRGLSRAKWIASAGKKIVRYAVNRQILGMP